MRIPFLTGWVNRTREKTRLLMAEGDRPRPIPGPWTLTAVVRGDEEPPPEAPRAPASPPPSREK